MSTIDRRAAWPVALVLALVFLAVDSAVRLRAIREVTAITSSDRPLPQPDAASPTGYADGQHQLILPALATDGYQWLMQTQRMLADGDVRVRDVSYENAPQGREVHWSGSVRWWLTSIASAYRLFHPELPMAIAVERMTPLVMPLLLAALLLLLTPLLACWLGAGPAALFALGCVAVYPFYQYSVAGLLDHHSIVAMCCFVGVVLIVAGGAGWVRSRDADSESDNERGAATPWVRTPRTAKRFFIASAVVTATGLWISAATIVPVMIGIGIGALLGAGLLARSPHPGAPAQPAPGLWRVWGVAGCMTSIAFYLLEYFPSHMGLRLEVNHPLYALAWLGAGDLLHRLCYALSGERKLTGSARWWVLGDAALIVLLPLTIVLVPATFNVTDPFLWALHDDYILEFRSLGSQFSQLGAWVFIQGTTSVLPVLLLPLAALCWNTNLTGAWKHVWRAPLVAVAALGVLYFHAMIFTSVTATLRAAGVLPANTAAATVLVQLVSLVPDAGVVALLFLYPRRRLAAPLPAPLKAMLVVTLVPAALLTLLAFSQIRWLGVSSVLLLAALVATAAVVKRSSGAFTATRAWRVAAGTFLVFVFAPFPVATALYAWQFGYPTMLEETQVVTRDVAYLLNERLGERDGVVASGPTTTTWLIYFGGVRGLGTLYWENLDGLKTAAAIYGARSDAEAKRLIDAHGVTHIVVFSWEPFAREYARLAHGERLDRSNPNAAPDAFILRLLAGDSIPPWLTRIPYALPESGLLQRAGVWIYEVSAPPQSPS